MSANSASPTLITDGHELPKRVAIQVFLVFAFVYFLSTLVRAIIATLAPELTEQFQLSAADLGLLAGSYFIGFSLMQLPLGHLLDRFGPPKVAMGFLLVALLGSSIFAMAQNFTMLLIGRTLLGLGLAAGLMAPLTAYRRWYAPATQLRANSWMLTAGSLGMLMSTLPVQWLVPIWGWRGIFWFWEGLVLLALAAILIWIPRWSFTPASHAQNPQAAVPAAGYGSILRNRRFISLAPLAFSSYGGLFAILTLWAGPWLQNVVGQTPAQAAMGLFWINIVVLIVFFTWGFCGPWLAKRAGSVERLATWIGLPGLLTLPVLVLLGQNGGWPWLALFCASLTGLALLQPKLAQTFPPELAGRALTAFNLMIFTGTFAMQWGIGAVIDYFTKQGFDTITAYRYALLLFWACNIAAYGWFLRNRLTANTGHSLQKA